MISQRRREEKLKGTTPICLRMNAKRQLGLRDRERYLSAFLYGTLVQDAEEN